MGICNTKQKNTTLNRMKIEQKSDFVEEITNPISVIFQYYESNKNVIITGHDDGAITTWDAETKKSMAKNNALHSSRVKNLMSIDGETLASSDDRGIQIWKYQSAESIKEIPLTLVKSIKKITFEGNLFLAVASSDKTIKLYDTIYYNNEPNNTLTGHSDRVNCIEELKGYKDDYIASGGADKCIKIWNLKLSACEKNLPNSSTIFCMSHVPEYDPNILVCGGINVTVWNIAETKTLFTISCNAIGILYIKDDIFVTNSNDNAIKFWSLKSGICVGKHQCAEKQESMCKLEGLEGSDILTASEKNIFMWKSSDRGNSGNQDD